MLVAAATVCDVLLRYLFAKPIRGYSEVSSLVTAVVVSAFLPAVLFVRGNVTIRLFGDLAGPRVARALDAFGALVTCGFFGLMTWQYVRYTIELAKSGERTGILRWNISPWWWVVTAMVGLTACAGLVMFVREWRGTTRPGPAMTDN